MSDLNWFFRSPRSAPQKGEKFSQLYLLRRDIDTCFGIDPNSGQVASPVDWATNVPIRCEAIWPGTMAVLAGIDLLGKFVAGTDKTHGPGSVGVGKRFVAFAERYLGLSSPDADLLYQLRNSLLHSFGLYSENTDSKGVVTATYNFVLTQGLSGLIEHLNGDYYRVDVKCLHELFEQAVSKYEAELRDTSGKDHKDLIDRFNAIFPKHATAMSVF